MRFYRLILTNPKGQVFVPNAAGGFDLKAPGANVWTFSSHLPTNTGGLQYNPGGLNVAFDFQSGRYAFLQQVSALISISGVGLQMIGQSTILNPVTATRTPGAGVVLYAGMQQGVAGAYGLANPAQAGVILHGQVYQSWGNWQGVNQTLEMFVLNGPVNPPQGIAWLWAQGQPLEGALFNALRAAYPTYQPNIKITPGLKSLNDQGGCYRDLTAFGGYLASYTQPLGKALGKDPYGGVQITAVGQTIYVYDDTVTPENSNAATQLNFQDLVGQPTWIGVATVNFKTVLRSDLRPGSRVIFPRGIIAPYATTTPEAAIPNAPSRKSSVFQGEFSILNVHHFANYRQPDGDSWVTTFDAVVAPAAA